MTSSTPKTPSSLLIHWFRRDLRVCDNPALARLLGLARQLNQQAGARVGIVFVYAGGQTNLTASQVWLDQSLRALNTELLGRYGLPLHYTDADWAPTLERVLSQSRHHRRVLSFCERYEPSEIALSQTIRAVCATAQCEILDAPGNYLLEPAQTCRDGHGPYKVFSAFARRAGEKLDRYALPRLPRASLKKCQTALDGLSPYNAMPGLDNRAWATRLQTHTRAGAAAATKNWQSFCNSGLKNYVIARDDFSTSGTSMMSAHLHFGEICVRKIYNDLDDAIRDGYGEQCQRLLSSLLWREFSNGWLYHCPQLTQTPMRGEFAAYPWRDDADGLRLWQQGRTGYPVVDAAMRQLRATGWMHNRLRMVTASFLIKHLLIDWRQGLHWFAENLLDADTANNALSWQWSAGSGFDSMPYMRIFNPVLQSSKFDTDGSYIRQWVSELADYHDDDIHCPEPRARQRHQYSNVCIEHKFARQRALDIWRRQLAWYRSSQGKS
ncbi:MAG: DNA photolyase family protein [Gammaproteobacteria bacterium]|nr:DNA photolyase family protein [Gammaproteobacteria bacterium]